MRTSRLGALYQQFSPAIKVPSIIVLALFDFSMKGEDMFLKKSGFILTVAAALSLGSLAANADSFATMSQNGGDGPAFHLTQSGGVNPFSVTGVVNVTFSYQVANGYQGNVLSPIQATMAFSGRGNPPAFGAGGFLFEDFDLTSFSILANTPVNGKNNLLSMDNTGTGTLAGKLKSQNVSLAGDTNSGDNVNFSSDFLSFANVSAENYTLTFSLQTGQSVGTSNGLYNPFDATGSGVFGSTPLPSFTPDGTGISLLSGGLLPFAGFALYRRRRAKK